MLLRIRVIKRSVLLVKLIWKTLIEATTTDPLY